METARKTANIDDAMLLVAKHFRGVVDKDGEPYVMHCLRVMMGVSDPRGQLVGLMHDLVEDTPITLDDLRTQGFDDAVVEAVELVTHKHEDSYAEYVVRLKRNELARQAKLSDLRDNCSMQRVLYRAASIDRDLKRVQRYVLSYQFLTDRIDEQDYRAQMQAVEVPGE